MATRRLISSDLSRSKKFNHLIPPGPEGHFARLLWVHLFSWADRWGRGEGDQYDVKSGAIPHYLETIEETEAALGLLHEVGLIIWYEHDGEKIYQITQWEEHQNFNEHNRKGKSKFPDPPKKKKPGRKVEKDDDKQVETGKKELKKIRENLKGKDKKK